MVRDRTLVEIHREFLLVLKDMEERGRTRSTSQVAMAMGSSRQTAKTHGQLCELYGKCKVFPNSKGTGHVIIPAGLIEPEKKEGENHGRTE